MNVIPFRRPIKAEPESEALAFGIGARVDLRVGALAGGVIRPRGACEDSFTFSCLARLLRAARMTWRERCAMAPLALAVPGELMPRLEADLLSEAALEAGCTRRNMAFELCERAIVNGATEMSAQLRARGWSVILRGDPDCPLPFGARARSLYSELVIDAPETPSPYLALDSADRSPLGSRIAAAKAAGLVITADQVRTAAQARILAMAGFDRGGGPFAEAGLR